MREEEVPLIPGDKIYLIIYKDHSSTVNENRSIREIIQEEKSNPHLLWCCGKIINYNDNDDFYVVLTSGAVNRFKKPYNYETIQKDCIVSMEVVYTIP